VIFKGPPGAMIDNLLRGEKSLAVNRQAACTGYFSILSKNA
jgi:hypothetical protein